MVKLPKRDGSILVGEEKLLLVDGNSLLKTAYHGAKNEYNMVGEHIGGIYAFMTIIRKIILSDVYDRIFVFWDGEFSGKLRNDIYPIYKANRKKNYDEGTKPQDESLLIQRSKIKSYLEELCIRQYEDQEVEADDCIAFICKNLSYNQKATILTNDSDLLILVNDEIDVYLTRFKEKINKKNFKNYFDFPQPNLLLIKVLCGDKGDNIKGVKLLKEEKLIEIMPEIKEKEVTLNQVLERVNELKNVRVSNGLKTLQLHENIINQVSLGPNSGNLFQINNLLVDLKNPLLTKLVEEDLNSMLNDKLNMMDRTIDNLFIMMKSDGLIARIGTQNINEYLLPFKKIINKEEKFKIKN